MTSGTVVVGITPAQAAMPAFQMPFPCGEVWKASTYSGHSAIDWNAYPSDNGRTVVASAAGTASLYHESLGGYQVIIDHGSGWKTVYAHLQENGRVTGSVSMGQAIGLVGNSGGGGSTLSPHLHWEQKFNNVQQSTLYANGVALSPGPSADQTAPAYTSNNCGGGSSGGRIGALNNGALDVKEGPLNATWVTVGGGSVFELSSNRVAVYAGTQLNVKEGGLGASWTTVTGSVDEFHLTDNRIGIRIGTQIFIKEGPIGATWVHVADGVSFAMSSNRLAVYNGSALNVKEGSIYAGWTTVTGQVDEYRVTDNRVGIRVGSAISVKEGPIGAMWTFIGSGSSFRMSPNRIAMYDDQLSVKEGPLNATWVAVTGAVDTFDVTDNRVGILVNGQLSIKDGPINATWTLVGGGSSFDLS